MLVIAPHQSSIKIAKAFISDGASHVYESAGDRDSLVSGFGGSKRELFRSFDDAPITRGLVNEDGCWRSMRETRCERA